jgi:O-antigen/teichoic acid export membrane protein
MAKQQRWPLRIVIIALLALPTAGAEANDDVTVYYAGPEGGVRTALGLASDFAMTNDLGAAEVVFLNGVIPDPGAIAARLEEGAGLVLILGRGTTQESLRRLLGVDVSLGFRDDPLSLVAGPGHEVSLLGDIVWTSAPQVRDRFALEGEGLTPLVSGYENGSLVIGLARTAAGRALVVAPFLDEANPQLQEWAYFNYLVYRLVTGAAGRAGLAFADYPGSPVPHEAEQIALYLALGFLLLVSLAAFVAVRRYSQAHPEALDRLVGDREQFERREARTDWEEIGFHRPLGGFLFALMFGLIFFIPLIIYQNLILPAYILPSAQALGIWGRVVQFFNLLWVLFDMGTSAAFIRFFAKERVRDPRRAIQYGQLFVWWQALSGAIQVALVTAIAGTLLPRTSYALYAWSIILHTMIQLPGFYQVFRYALKGLQRFDYAQILEMAWALVFPLLTQPVIVTLMVAWGRTQPVFGPAMGGLFGLGAAAYTGEALTFLLGWWLYRRLGYQARLLFLAHFDWHVMWTAFRFGVFDMLASVAWMIGQAMEILLTQRLVNYAEVWGNWTIAQNFIYAYQVVSTLFENLVPAISEAISHGRRALAQYYSVVAYKWGGLISAFIGAVLLAVADRFILGATGPEFVRAAAYAAPLIVWGAIQYPSWVGDNVQLGANHPYLKACLVAGEQVIRIGLAAFLLGRLQVYGLIVAYFVGLLSKDLAAYAINHRVCFPQRFYFWQSLAAPILAGAADYALVRGVGGLIWRGDQVTSVVVFFLGILPSFPAFAFFYGLLGGWDDEGLEELKRAADLSGFMRPLALLFWRSTSLGARLSPLHNRFPIRIRAAAMEEARSLTEERVAL